MRKVLAWIGAAAIVLVVATLDIDAFRSNTEKLCAFYKRQGAIRAEKEVLELARLTDTTASVRTSDTLFDASGAVVTAWAHVDILSDTGKGIRVAAALPDNEVRAWRERGTPLGSE